MQMLCRIVFVVLCSFLPSIVLADGLIYQLPPDGTWVRFQADGTWAGANGRVVTLTGTMTLSSVGVAQVAGEACRWIEFGQELKADGEPSSSLHKLLIPEQHLGKGQDPLAHVRKAWSSVPHVMNGAIQEIPNPQGSDRLQLNGQHLFLHGPIQNSKPLSPLEVVSKLGKLTCEGLTAQQRTEPGAKVLLDSTYSLRLHRSAPFGVVTFESTSKVQRDKKDEATNKWKLKLLDYGQNAKSKFPNAK